MSWLKGAARPLFLQRVSNSDVGQRLRSLFYDSSENNVAARQRVTTKPRGEA